ncbi:HAD-IA family hydrolase [Sphingomonas sp. KR1UV-12]|uniref:HAD-IA family hydrolase n=1 Tax=Sphingomonas aurea TaxID=3063994 RepID=A0ABT9EKJ1_9SPHN|nr:HAD-IA family hydrolase [Sphingomonas sp. KR1UV-12]MDP1027352.1 HAD-IA family hydrolase [Sphingomonas sp. KR1UV-12]
MTVRLAVFDCDGTLVDSQANIGRAMDETFAAAGLAVPPRAATRAIVGLSLAEAMRVLAPGLADADHHALAAEYKLVYQRLRRDDALDDEPLFEGVAAAIDGLAAAGWTLGVATGKSDRGLAHVLERHGLTHRFATLQTADRHPSKPDPAMLLAAMAEVGATPANTAMIGDTSFDMAMARAAGARAVGVAWGYHDTAELADAGAAVIAQHADELVAMLERAPA